MGRAPALIWCPTCEKWTNCRSINASDIEWGEPVNYRQYEHGGVHYHRRFRQCSECSEEFYTAELADDEFCDLLAVRAELAHANAKLAAIRKGLRATAK